MTWLLVALGAAVGAPARYLVDAWLHARLGPAFPWGTLAVNVTGSAALGVVAALASAGGLAPPWSTGLAVGLCGAFTTYSTFAWETLRLLEVGAGRRAAVSVVANVVGCLAAVSAGWALGTLVAG